ncbi:Methyl-CpG binding protein 2/3 C-terminal domain-containing protein [Caenorhabditis elegans]|uniref:Methyl-CpG binding protein 2/3 C-terminal domain-containing protein n=1 Tax=Caenorhabditis elegans TaxID=6239 RepID=G5ECR1_CAEEL|nr:Methyl-CpG binding protein 2/3 C-terminal domain-containing protein [Caenorhabditis elegans]AAY32916.1 methyl-binding protein-2 [Caenorhabditis elegans]CCD61208.1 Methyl-CpG binding protein 2/3 C-terminal domain-containing protein [Caenorhabditis elegans]|eukprot:NP_001021012.1 Methyl-CpG BinDing protein [Caenorhabditis elegans]
MAKADALFRQRRPGRPVKARPVEKDIKTGFDGNWDLVVRKCPTTFSQHVSEVTTAQPETKVQNDELLKRRSRRKTEMRPFQAMWAKSLSGLQVSIPHEKPDRIGDVKKAEYSYESIKKISLIKPGVSAFTPEEAMTTVIQQMNNGFMTNGTFGQAANKDKLDVNFIGLALHDQPLCERIPIAHIVEEISSQEKRVLDARKRLQEVMKYFG